MTNNEVIASNEKFQETLFELPTEVCFDTLTSFFKDGKSSDFPPHFAHKDEFFRAGRSVYEAISIEGQIKQIRIETPFDGAGQTKPNADYENVEVIVSISASKLGIGCGEGGQQFAPEQCKEFADVLAHELFHVQNIFQHVNRFGIEDFRKAYHAKDCWSKLAWIIFDEYSACRKNAEQFGSFESVEIAKSENIDKILNAIQGLKDPNSDFAFGYIGPLFYTLATISAFSDVSEVQEKNIENHLPSAISKTVFVNARNVFNQEFANRPLNAEQYYELGCKLKDIIGISE